MSETTPCPECGEEILAVAIKCRYCGVALDKKAVEAERRRGGSPGILARKISCGALIPLTLVGGPALAFGFGILISGDTSLPFLVSSILFLGLTILAIGSGMKKEHEHRLLVIPLWTACLLVPISAALVAWWLLGLMYGGSEKSGNESSVVGALKTIGTAQSLFREADKEADGNLDYGTLSELDTAGATGLIDSVLASGTKYGYIFSTTYGAMTSEFIWFATARPVTPGTTGDRYFCANHEGVTYYTTAAPFRMNSVECTIPAGATPVGR